MVLANLAKEEQTKKKDNGKQGGPKTKPVEGVVNADGTPKLENQVAIDARKRLRIDKLCHFMLLEDERVAGNLTASVIQVRVGSLLALGS